MSERPDFPPLFRPFAVTPELDPFERCLGAAADGAEPGTLLWSSAEDTCECAVALAPEQPLEPSLPIVLVTELALGDALGALVPPVVAVTFGWPDRIEVNGAIAGGVRMAYAEPSSPQAIPDWMVLGIRLALRGGWAEGEEPGRRPDRTTLADEGCGEVTTVDLLEAFGRHFLAWINRWQEDGPATVQKAWLARATGLGRPVEVRVGGKTLGGTFSGLTEHGGMRLARDGVSQTIALNEAMRTPSWSR
jgi:BirA family biotin operon repressor/biotin-[acetyl-CoA-carboxylase] ligase